ncbi:MAG: DNA translocase FtsK 4TM domain-containing protein [Chloroflexi bacterium]|nr:DNA translocase FtsK 4TM domain-containing protein [Chloroflexota bacterium]
MAEKKSARAKTKEEPKPPKPVFRLDADRWEEIGAIGVFILALLTFAGALNLSGGFLVELWVGTLRTLLGWGVYFTPFILIALSIWMFLDAIDHTWNIGWERPLGVGVLYVFVLAVLHWAVAFDNPMKEPRAFAGGGMLGWTIASLLISALGAIGAALAMTASIGVALILLFNISLPELGRRILYVARIIPHLPQELSRRPAEPRATQPPLPTISPRPRPSAPFVTPRDLEPRRESPAPVEPPAPPRGPVAARIIGGNAPAEPVPPAIAASDAPTPIIQREWRLPEWSGMLEESIESDMNQHEIRERVHRIEETLQHFGVPAKVIEVNQGPTITQFGVEPGFVEQKGVDGKVHRVKVKVSRISALQHDLELALAAAPIRIEAPVPGRSVVGIEVPNSQIARVSLRGVMESDVFKNLEKKTKLRIALGQDVAGQPVCANLESMPHLLIAGATGSGKSVCVNAVIAGLLCTTTPADVRFVMVDPKRVELVNFNGIPHLLLPVVVEMDQAVAALENTVKEMDRRFKLFQSRGARNIEIYNQIVEGKPDEEKLPFLIVIVDELADLMMVAPDQVEHTITRLAQMARATGIHLILATQRPSVDVVTGLIKANFPSRISFAVTSQIDSRVVLDTPGAEKLLGRGDMLYMASDSSKLVRLQGCFVSDRELEKLVSFWKDFTPPPLPTSPTTTPSEGYEQVTLWGEVAPKPKTPSGDDDLLPQAMDVLQQNNRASISLLQRKLRIGYSRAARLMELLEEKGFVGPDEGPTKGRSVRAPDTNESLPRAQKTTPASRRTFEEENDPFADFTEEDWEELDKG